MIVGNPRDGAPLQDLAAGQKWVCRFAVGQACRLAKLSLRLDGLGAGSGTQRARAVAYTAAGALVGYGDEVSVADGQAAGWVDFPLLGLHPGGLPLAAGDHDLGLIADAASQVIRLHGEAAGGTAKFNSDAYADGPSSPFGSGTARAGLLALVGAIFLPASAPPGADDFHLARLGFPDAQAALGSRPGLRASGTLTRAGWHGTSVHPERGSFAVAKTGSPYALLVGQRVKVTTRGTAKPRSVYALVATEADVVEELSLSRRLFMALEVPALADCSVVVEEVAQE